MRTELVRVTTSDGLLLDGILQLPDGERTTLGGVDAFLLVHGTGSNFYAPGVLETFARQAVDAGVPALRINTRGHDGMASIPGPRGSVRGGAAYETIAECRHDLAAWLDWLSGRGFQRVALAGHSMGGVKAIYSQAHDPHPVVACVIGISPPRFCHKNLSEHPKGAAFREDEARARDLVATGRGDELMQAQQPLPLVLTAEGFLAKYGPHDDYDTIRWLPRLRPPTLVIVGTQSMETSPAFDRLPEAIAAAAPQVQVEIVEGAGTTYAGMLDEPFHRVERWLVSREGTRGR